MGSLAPAVSSADLSSSVISILTPQGYHVPLVSIPAQQHIGDEGADEYTSPAAAAPRKRPTCGAHLETPRWKRSYPLMQRTAPKQCSASPGKSAKKRKTGWSPEENRRLKEAVMYYGAHDWAKIAKFVGSPRDNKQCRQRWFLAEMPELKENMRRGKWTAAEDEKLQALVQKCQPKTTNGWIVVSKEMGYTRNHKQCRERWTNYVDPAIKKGPFTSHEQKEVLMLYNQHKHCRRKLCQRIAGAMSTTHRTAEQVRSHFRKTKSN